MRCIYLFLLFLLLFTGSLNANPGSPGREFLTDQEIDDVRDAQEIDKRIKVYMQAAAARLKTAEDRLNGIESTEEDPLEFFSPEDMLDGYYQILKSVMANLDAAYQNPDSDQNKIRKALTTLKKATEQAAKQLGILKKLAEEKNKEELWNLVNKSIKINEGAREGADYGLSILSESSKKKDNR